MNPKGVTFSPNQDKIQFSNNLPWGHIEDDHIPFIEHRQRKISLHVQLNLS